MNKKKYVTLLCTTLPSLVNFIQCSWKWFTWRKTPSTSHWKMSASVASSSCVTVWRTSRKNWLNQLQVNGIFHFSFHLHPSKSNLVLYFHHLLLSYSIFWMNFFSRCIFFFFFLFSWISSIFLVQYLFICSQPWALKWKRKLNLSRLSHSNT